MSLRSQTISLQPIGKIAEDELKPLKHDLMGILSRWDLEIKISSQNITLDESSYNPQRDQYNASLVLNNAMREIKDQDLLRMLGIVNKDLFSSHLNFVFGIAQMPK
ncbi:MAG: hypothetical protein ACOCT9_02920, partial [archaeon]